MDAVRRFLRKLGLLVRRREFHEELAEEMAFHREEVQQRFRAQGVGAEEARYAASRQFGNPALLTEQSLDAVGFRVETMWQDFRYALRGLRKNPGFAATTITILALGIGATAAIFSAVDPILFEPLPYPQGRRLMIVNERRPDGAPMQNTFASYFGLTQRSRSFEAVAAMKPWLPTMTGPGEPERFEGQRVSAPYFRALDIAPARGRDFQASDDQYRGPDVVILSDKLWRRRFHNDPGIVGQAITLDDTRFTVVGVMPATFENVLAPAAELWAPLQYNTTLPPWSREWGHHLRIVGRLRDSVSRQQAESELNVMMHTLAQQYASGYDTSGGPPAGFLVTALREDVTRAVRPALLAVLGAVILVLLIACVNVTNLLLARGAQRRGEFAVRAALGAAPVRMVRQLLTESLVLALVGGAVGLVIAQFGVRALIPLSPPDLPRLGVIRLNATVFAFGMALTTVIGGVVGMVPALHAARGNLHSTMQASSRRTAGSHQWTRRLLVVAEVGLALMLLVSAGLLLRSLRRLFAIDPGFDASHLLTMQVQESGRRYDKDDARRRFFHDGLERVREAPGVVSAGFTGQLPLSGDYEVYGAQLDNETPDQGEGLLRYAVTPGYLETMRIPLRAGRLFTEQDNEPGAARVAIINESLARRKYPNQDPIGRKICIRCGAGGGPWPWSTIIGVVGDVRQTSLELKDNDAVYLPNTQWYWADQVMSLVVRTRGSAAALAPAIRSAIWSVDKDQPIVRVATMEHLLAGSQSERHFALVLFEAFAVVALLLAATGIYGVLAGSVAERMREIGVRAALGASRGDIVAMIFRQAMTLTGWGIVIGIAGALAASRALISLLFGISRIDPLTYTGVVLLLIGISALACSVPAWRAARVDPSITLRAE
jgi:putative ABC transport system permease protein